MKKIAILAGKTELPLIIANKLAKQKIAIQIYGIQDSFNPEQSTFPTIMLKSSELLRLPNMMKNDNTSDLLCLGAFPKPKLADLPLQPFIIKLLTSTGGDNNLLAKAASFLKQRGIKIHALGDLCPELLITESQLTTHQANEQDQLNFKKAQTVFKIYGSLDVGQSIIIQNNEVLGLEAVEGTDELITRCANYKQGEDLGILFKATKHKQDLRFDVPVIGLSTLKLLKEHHYAGIFLEKNRCLLLEKEEAITYANDNHLFIQTF